MSSTNDVSKISLPLSGWLHEHGLRDNPFDAEAFQAETDPEFAPCFIQFGYYDEILGKPKSPGPRFVFARRGTGKTALRRQIEGELNSKLLGGEEKTLAIVYNDFDVLLEATKGVTKDITPRMHVERIITLIVLKLFELVIQPKPPFRFSDLKNPHSRQLLRWYIHAFGHLHAWQISKTLAQLKDLSHFLDPELVLSGGKKALKGVAALTLPPLAQGLVGALDEIITWKKPPEIEPRMISIYDLLEGIINICGELGLDAVYVLVDDVDEPQYYGDLRDFSPAFELIRPLAAAPKLLSIKGLVFKFFLPMEIKSRAETAFRLDKHKAREVLWNDEDLHKVLNKRLEVYKRKDEEWASRPPPHLDELCVPELRSLEDKVVAEARGSPRDLLRLCNELLAQHFKEDVTQELLLTVDCWRAAIKAIKEDHRQQAEFTEPNAQVAT